MNQSRSESERGEEEQTLLAVKEFNRFLGGVEKDLSRISKKLHNKETTQSARFLAAGIQEARQYLEIVKKVIERTQQALKKGSPKQTGETRTSPKPLLEEEAKGRTLIDTRNGVEIWQGECEGCHKDTRIASDGTHYLCVDCLKNPKLISVTERTTKIRKRSHKRPTSKKRGSPEDGNILFKTREYIRRGLAKIH